MSPTPFHPMGALSAVPSKSVGLGWPPPRGNYQYNSSLSKGYTVTEAATNDLQFLEWIARKICYRQILFNLVNVLISKQAYDKD